SSVELRGLPNVASLPVDYQGFISVVPNAAVASYTLVAQSGSGQQVSKTISIRVPNALPVGTDGDAGQLSSPKSPVAASQATRSASAWPVLVGLVVAALALSTGSLAVIRMRRSSDVVSSGSGGESASSTE